MVGETLDAPTLAVELEDGLCCGVVYVELLRCGLNANGQLIHKIQQAFALFSIYAIVDVALRRAKGLAVGGSGSLFFFLGYIWKGPF